MGYTTDLSFRRGLLESSSTSSSFLNPLQSQVDECVSRFTEQALDLKSIGAMMAGGMAYRLGRIGAMATGTGRLFSLGIGLGTEVTAFEMTHRSLQKNPNLWRWDGKEGLCQGLLSSLVTFGALKGAGRLAQGENIVVQHLLQDTGMVLGHQVSGAFGITPRPTESLAEQFLHAEATNLQLSAGMALVSRLAPLAALEKGVDLSLRSTETPSLLPWKIGESIHQAWAMAGTGSEKSQSFYTMKSLHTAERERGGGPSALQDTETLPSIFTEGNPYFLNKRVPDGLPIIRVREVPSGDFVGTMAHTLDEYLKKKRTSLLIHYEGSMPDTRKQDELKIKIKAMFEGGSRIPDNFMLAIAITKGLPKMALIYEKKANVGMVPSWAQIRRPDPSPRPLSAAKTTSIPHDVKMVDSAENIPGILSEILQTENPTLCFTGSSWRMSDSMSLAKQLETLGLDRRKNFALLLKEQSVQIVFQWEREQGQDKVQFETKPIGYGSASSGVLPKVPAFSEPSTTRPRFSAPPPPPPQPRTESTHPSPSPSDSPSLRKAEPRRSSETLTHLAETQAIIERMKAPKPPEPPPPEVKGPDPIKIPCDDPSKVLEKLGPLLEYQRWKPFVLELKTGSLDEDFLPTLDQHFKDHPFREGQDVSIVWEGSYYLKIWKEKGQMKAELRKKVSTTAYDGQLEYGIVTEKFLLLPGRVEKEVGYQYSKL